MTVHQPSVADSYTWDPPGPGSWSLAADHYPRPITAALAPFNEVWGEVSTAWLFEIGLPIRAARMVTVNGLPYLNFEFEGGGGERQPPAWLLRLLVRVVPSLRRAEARASRYLAARPWVDSTRQWYDHDRAEAIDQLSAIARIDPWTLGDDTLAAHLLEVESSWLDHTRRHHVLHAHDQLPVYLFAARMVEWGFDTETAFGLLAPPPLPPGSARSWRSYDAPSPGATQPRSRSCAPSDPRSPKPSTGSSCSTAGASSTATTSTTGA
jgi:hypothetical protein